MQQQKVRPKGIYSVLGGAASSYKFVKEFPGSRPVHHGLQSLVRPAQPEGPRIEEEGRGCRPVLHLRGLPELLQRAAGRRCAKPCRLARPRQGDGGAGSIDLCGSHHALWPDEVRQRTEPGRCSRQHAGARQRHPGDLPGERSQAPSRCSRCRRRRGSRTFGRDHLRSGVGTDVFACHPDPRNHQRRPDGRRLCADCARIDADLWRAAHHQLRAWRAADGGAVCGLFRVQGSRDRSLHLGVCDRAAVLRARIRAAAFRDRSGLAWRRAQRPAGDARARDRDREPGALRLPRRYPHHRRAGRFQRHRCRRRAARRFPGRRLWCGDCADACALGLHAT